MLADLHQVLFDLLRDVHPEIVFSPWVVGPTIFVLWLAVLLKMKRWLLAALHGALEGRTGWHWANTLIEAISPGFTIAIYAGGIAILDRILPLSPRTDSAIAVILSAAVVLTLIIFLERICRHLISRVALKSAPVQGAQNLLEAGVRGVIIALGLLIFLDSIGISITPVLASLGIGTLAVALALQDTLANLFAGIYMIAEKPIAVGNFIRLEGGQQGYVTKVGWRSTQIKMIGDTMVVVPNAKLAGSVITNLSLPHEELSPSVEVGVDYDSDLERVEQVTLEVAREVIAEVPGARKDFQPRVRFHTFAESSINFRVWLAARDFESSLLVQSQFIKRLHARYRLEGISIPAPVRTIDLSPNAVIELGKLMALSAAAGPNGGRAGLGKP